MAILWEEWLGSNGDWTTSSYALRLSRTHSQENVGARRWMTFKQLVEKYDDVAVAESIREAKWNDPVLCKTHCKPHPDCPENPATRLQPGHLWSVGSCVPQFRSRRFDDIDIYIYLLNRIINCFLVCPKPKVMELFLVWDSESEITKEGTMLESTLRVDDRSDSSEPRRSKRKRSRSKKKKKKRSSSSSSPSSKSSESKDRC